MKVSRLGWKRIIAAGLVLAALIYPARAAADSAYSDGEYSDCPYAQACPSTSPSTGSSGGGTGTSAPTESAAPTVGQLPSGLQYSINVRDGQVFPPAVYTIEITPLNGQGATFSKVEVYLDGVLVATPAPASTGTVYWPWDVSRYPASRISFKITDSTGQVTTREFTVRIASASSPTPASNDFVSELRKAIHNIPPVVIYTFPWLLFILLAIAIALLVWQVRREVAESERLRALLARERALAQEKTTFIQVASHYLRTPLTLVIGGQDLAAIDPKLAGFASAIRNSVQALKEQVENLLAEITQRAESANVTDPDLQMPLARVWLRPAFIIPLVSIGLLATTFNVLVATVGQIALPVVNVLLQAAAFLVLALGLYVVLRSLQLRRRERVEAERLMQQRQTVDESRNQLIHEAVEKLAGSVNSISEAVGKHPSSTATDTVRKGLARFHSMLTDFAIAEQVRTAGASTAPAIIDLGEVITKAVAASADEAQAKRLQVTFPEEHAKLPSLNPDLLIRAVSNVLNNAVAYSPAGTHVTLEVIGGLKADQIIVRDEGPGIPKAQLDELFQPFFRSEGALNFTHEGMGFSLYLDKLIMHYLGGDIAVQPNNPKGLVVTLSFPA
jgi:signal transduction histidine kinase